MSAPAHQWDISAKKHMTIENSDDIYDLPTVIDPSEAERCVEGLVKFNIEDIGSSKWVDQHLKIEKLNLQAHQSAMTNSDEYVIEALLTFGKLEVLIHDLLVIEAWKENVFSKLKSRVAGRNSIRVYFILYHEATVVNLLEVLLYHKHVCEAGGEKMLEIVDYVARKLARLNSGYDFSAHDCNSSGSKDFDAKEYAAELEQRTPEDDLTRHLTEIEFRVCISSCSLARFLCEHADSMPLSVVSRITDTHDILILLVPLIENPPWTRRSNKGKWQKLIDQKWSDVAPIDLMKVTKLEGQPWLGLYHLLAKEVFRERYHLNSFRKSQVLRVRKYINEVILDQLPFLADIQRYMDELSLTDVPEPHNSTNSVFLFQQVAIQRESLLKGKNWEDMADYQMENIFTMTDKDDKDLKKMSDLYSDELAEGVLEPSSLDY
mmetsp:Transcript_4636/g.4779  ORF Transcript_4636/g.4779 Transcript_4636/m.4779 type:complete len:433 (+) Transcript_4636:71-1369(+)